MIKILPNSQFNILFKKSNVRSGSIIYEGSVIGEGLTTGHNAIIREGNTIGNNVLIGTNSYLGPNNKIGDNVRIHTGCFIESAILEDNVIIAPHVVFTNDKYPPCKKCMEEGSITIKSGTVVGANVTILPKVVIGENCLIGAGSVVTKDIDSNSIAVGNPARIIGSNKKHTHS